MTTITAQIGAIFGKRGSGAYFGESVSMTQHALQTAYFARAARAPPPLIVAALLHDVGHLVEEVPDDLADWLEDARHEEIGARWLAARFPSDVSEPVRLHVCAKRYLCATDPFYRSKLSSASIVTLQLQGGPMSAAEIARFEAERHFGDAVQLRRWDDQAKIEGFVTPGLTDHGPLIEGVAAVLFGRTTT